MVGTAVTVPGPPVEVITMIPELVALGVIVGAGDALVPMLRPWHGPHELGLDVKRTYEHCERT